MHHYYRYEYVSIFFFLLTVWFIYYVVFTLQALEEVLKSNIALRATKPKCVPAAVLKQLGTWVEALRSLAERVLSDEDLLSRKPFKTYIF